MCRLGHGQPHPDEHLVKQVLHADAPGCHSMGSPSCLAHTGHKGSTSPPLVPVEALTFSNARQDQWMRM